jgi:hypothetical protein
LYPWPTARTRPAQGVYADGIDPHSSDRAPVTLFLDLIGANVGSSNSVLMHDDDLVLTTVPSPLLGPDVPSVPVWWLAAGVLFCNLLTTYLDLLDGWAGRPYRKICYHNDHLFVWVPGLCYVLQLGLLAPVIAGVMTCQRA